jgi:hypothetical protein
MREVEQVAYGRKLVEIAKHDDVKTLLSKLDITAAKVTAYEALLNDMEKVMTKARAAIATLGAGLDKIEELAKKGVKHIK